MKNYFKNTMAQLAQLAFYALMYCFSIFYTACTNGTLLAQLAFSKIVCATYAKFVPLKNTLKALLLLNCATCATYAKQVISENE
jgi:hypothetical protein